MVRLDKNTRQIMVDVEHTKVPEKYRPPLLRYDEMGRVCPIRVSHAVIPPETLSDIFTLPSRL